MAKRDTGGVFPMRFSSETAREGKLARIHSGDTFRRGPGPRALPAESIGPVSPFPGGSDRIPQDEAGLSDDRRSLLPGSQTVAGNPRPVGPTGPGNGSRLMVSAGNALDPGLERASKTLTFI